MSTALWGAGLVLAAAVWASYTCHVRQGQRRALLWAFASALGEMESSIRWQRTPLPRLIERLGERQECGKWFRRIMDGLQGGIPLQTLWDSVFAELEDREGAEILRRVALCGDHERIIGALGRAREELETLYHRRCIEDRQRMRVTAAAAVCGAGFIIILLV